MKSSRSIIVPMLVTAMTLTSLVAHARVAVVNPRHHVTHVVTPQARNVVIVKDKAPTPRVVVVKKKKPAPVVARHPRVGKRPHVCNRWCRHHHHHR